MAMMVTMTMSVAIMMMTMMSSHHQNLLVKCSFIDGDDGDDDNEESLDNKQVWTWLIRMDDG